MSTLRLVRRHRLLVDQWGLFTILLDGKKVATIANRETTDVSVEAGTHTLELTRFSWATCPRKTFDVTDGETASFVVRPRAGWPLAFLWLVATAVFRHDLWIALRHGG